MKKDQELSLIERIDFAELGKKLDQYGINVYKNGEYVDPSLVLKSKNKKTRTFNMRNRSL